jgi:hypothetical protein
MSSAIQEQRSLGTLACELGSTNTRPWRSWMCWSGCDLRLEGMMENVGIYREMLGLGWENLKIWNSKDPMENSLTISNGKVILWKHFDNQKRIDCQLDQPIWLFVPGSSSTALAAVRLPGLQRIDQMVAICCHPSSSLCYILIDLDGGLPSMAFPPRWIWSPNNIYVSTMHGQSEVFGNA